MSLTERVFLYLSKYACLTNCSWALFLSHRTLVSKSSSVPRPLQAKSITCASRLKMYLLSLFSPTTTRNNHKQHDHKQCCPNKTNIGRSSRCHSSHAAKRRWQLTKKHQEKQQQIKAAR